MFSFHFAACKFPITNSYFFQRNSLDRALENGSEKIILLIHTKYPELEPRTEQVSLQQISFILQNKAKYLTWKTPNIVEAVVDFVGFEKDHLSFKKGDKIKIINSSDSNYWIGRSTNGYHGTSPFSPTLYR
jgi:hypothetical protein